MSEVLLTTNLPREKSYIYFVGTDPTGNLTVCRARSGRVKKEKEGQ